MTPRSLWPVWAIAWWLALHACATPARRARSRDVRPPQAATPIRVALTLDDVPGGFETPSATSKLATMDTIVRTLKAHRVEHAVAFVNGALAQDADGAQALSVWTEAGYEVGNHTFSHRSARALSPGAFLADVARNQRFLEALPQPPRVRYFRFPYLERGSSAEDRARIARALRDDGYQVADVSVDFSDWAYVAPFARCLARGDPTAQEALTETYLEHAAAALFWAVESAERLLGRAIPHVLLLHARAPTAQNLDALLTAYEQQGVRFITLAEALSDPAYKAPPDRDRGDTGLLSELARSTGRSLRSGIPRSLALLELACR